MELYTLQECFEQAGSVFPFTVIFHDFKRSKNCLINFIDKEIIKDDYIFGLKWIPKNAINSYNYINNDAKVIYHVAFAVQKLYEYKPCKFDKDMLDLLSEGEEK